MISIDFHKVLRDVTLDVRFDAPAEGITALFGRNGAGKSSVVSAIAGGLRPDAGRIVVNGVTFFDSHAGIDLAVERRGVGYVFQDSRLFPHLSVHANLLYGFKRFRGTPRVKADEVIGLLGLGDLLPRRPHALSGGERQRVGIGRALLSQPAFLLMDEPLASLDPPRKAELLPYIESVRDEFGLPVIYISHDFNEVMRLADHLVLMDAGRVARHGPLLELASDPALALLIGRFEAGTVLDATVIAHDPPDEVSTLQFAGGTMVVPTVAAPVGSPIRVRVRARDVALSLSEPAYISITNRLSGTLVDLTPRDGPFLDASVAVGDVTFRAVVTRQTRARLGLHVGQAIWVLFKTAALDSRSVGFTRRDRSSHDAAEVRGLARNRGSTDA